METTDKSQDSGDAALIGLSTPHAGKSSDTDGRHHHSSHAAASAMNTPTKNAPIHPRFLPSELTPLGWIAGEWTVHEPGQVVFPTIKPFTFAEKIEFVFSGQKMLDYKAESWNPAVGPGQLMHRETGFLRIKPGSDQVALVIAHNFGVSEILEGTNSENKLELETTGISRMAFASEPEVIKNRRTFTYNPATEELEHVMEMQTSRTPLTEHLRIKYKRALHQISAGH